MTITQAPRTPLVVSGDVLTIGHAQRHAGSGEVTGNDALFSAYIDFLRDLRSAAPTAASLRAADLDVLALVTGMSIEAVRDHLESMLQAQQAPQLTRRARKRVFASVGVCILGGALILASTISKPATSHSAAATGAVKIGSALTIDRVESLSDRKESVANAVDHATIDSALTLERSNIDLPPGVDIESALTIEQ